jgi:TonB family protein
MKLISLACFTALLMLGAAIWCAAQNAPQNKAAGKVASKAPVIEAVALTEGITPPRLSEVASPNYTAEAKKKKIEGTVTLAIVVDKNGDVVEAKVVKGLGYGLDENAVIAVKEWKYKPAEKDGEPIAVRMEVTVDFYLQG